MLVSFHEDALQEYIFWQFQDRKTLKKINDLIKDIRRNGAAKGIGKPEPLKHRPGWSRRIDDANRLVYDVSGDNLYIISCKGHYSDK
jgi:toxin YoeB